VCFDLGTGTGGVLRCMDRSGKGLVVGIDNSREALAGFHRGFGEAVLCPVENASRTFRKGCADLVLANPPYFVSDRGRPSPDRLRGQAREAAPMTIYRFIFAGAHLLRPGGTMAVT
jgi:tRNA1(Val) A37 N6-methylase TrmN6